jgi:hypothetical protein
MRDHEEHERIELQRLTSRLPRETPPPADLWPGIEAELLRPSLDSLARELAANIEPPIDLWPQIAARLSRDRSRLRLAAAAAIFAALASLLVAIATRNVDVEPAPSGLRADLPGQPETAPASNAGVWWMLQMPPISDEIAATIQQNLGIVRDERRAIEQAIERNPSDSHLRELWAYAYETELRLENEVGNVIVSYQRGYGI